MSSQTSKPTTAVYYVNQQQQQQIISPPVVLYNNQFHLSSQTQNQNSLAAAPNQQLRVINSPIINDETLIRITNSPKIFTSQNNQDVHTPQSPSYTIIMQNKLPPQRIQSPQLYSVSSSNSSTSPAANQAFHPGNERDNQDSANQQTEHELMLKCSRFLKTLLRYKTQQQPLYNILEVKKLIREVVLGEQTPEEFTAKLREVTKSQDKGNLLPFLRRSLPILRRSIQNGEELELRQALDLDDFVQTSELPLRSIKHEITEFHSNPVIRDNSNSPAKPNVQTKQSEFISKEYKIEENFNIEKPGHRDFSRIQESITENYKRDIAMPKRTEEIAENDVLSKQQDLLNHVSNVIPIDSTSSEPCNNTIYKLPRMLLNPQALADRILAHMPGAEGVDPEVLSIISNAAEARLRTILAHLAVLAAHRLEPLKLNPMYQIIDEPRKQLRFMEDIDKRAHENRQTAEKEALLKITKSKGKDRDTLEKAKQLQKADREEMVNREANAAAFAALGGSRIGSKRPFTSSFGMNGMHNQGLGFGLTGVGLIR